MFPGLGQFRQCFGTVGWVRGRASDPLKILPVCHLSLSLGSFEECIEEETGGDWLAKAQLEYGH